MSSGINRRLGERSSAFLICCLIVIIAFALRSGRGFEYTTDLPVEAESRALADGEVCEQMIPDGAKTIRVLSVKFGVSGIGSEDRLKAVFLKNGEAVKTWEVDTDYLPADNYWNFVFDRPLKVGGDDHCSFTVSRISRGELQQLHHDGFVRGRLIRTGGFGRICRRTFPLLQADSSGRENEGAEHRPLYSDTGASGNICGCPDRFQESRGLAAGPAVRCGLSVPGDIHHRPDAQDRHRYSGPALQSGI